MGTRDHHGDPEGVKPGRRPGDLPRVVVPEVTRAAVDELRRVGNNLNQVAHVANAEGRIGDVDELRRVLVELEDCLRLVRGQRPPRVTAPDPVTGDGGQPVAPEPAGDVDAAVADTTPATAAARAAAILARVSAGRGETPEAPPRRWFGGRR